MFNVFCFDIVLQVFSFYFSDQARTEDDGHVRIPSNVRRVSEDVQFGVKVSVKSEQLQVPMISFSLLRRTLSYGKSARTMS